jgi:hypothetical protein
MFTWTPAHSGAFNLFERVLIAAAIAWVMVAFGSFVGVFHG